MVLTNHGLVGCEILVDIYSALFPIGVFLYGSFPVLLISCIALLEFLDGIA